MLSRLFVLFPLWAFISAAALSAAIVRSPDGSLTFHISVNDEGQPFYSIRKSGVFELKKSKLGLVIDGQTELNWSGFETREQASVDEVRDIRGSASQALNIYNEATFSPKNSRKELVVQVRDDSVAFRYRLTPEDKSSHTVTDERTEFALPSGSVLWNSGSDYENAWMGDRWADLKPGQKFAMPMLAELAGSRGYLLITESDSVDYLATGLQKTGGDRLRATYQLSRADQQVIESAGVIETPWRIVMVAKNLNKLIQNHTVALTAPDASPELKKAEWIQPGVAAWAWVSGGFKGQNPENMRRHIEAAGKLGWKYVIVDDGWEHWDDKWERVKELCELGDEKNVGIILWKPTDDNYGPKWQREKFGDLKPIDGLIDPTKRTNFLKKCAEVGVAGLKVDFVGEGNVQRVNYYADLLREAAEHELVINFHGCSKPTGLDQTFPNELTREAIRGLEWSHKDPPVASLSTIMPFTRGVIGHADYTPYVGFENKAGTIGHQLATLVAFVSPMNAYAIDPEKLLERPEVEFVKTVPTVWDESRVLEPSVIGESAIIARRSGSDWFIAVLNNSKAKAIEVDLSPLLAGSGRLSGWQDDKVPNKLIELDRDLVNGETFTLQLRELGGALLRLSSEEK